MKLILINIWEGRLTRPLEDLLRAEKPDVLCLQEVIRITGDTAGIFLTLEEIQEILGYKYVFFSPVFTMGFMRRMADFGNAIVSKFPITARETLFTNDEYVPDYDYLEHSQNIRNLQYVKLDTPSGVVHVLNHHGHRIPDHKNGDAETMRQCQLIADFVSKLEGKVVLAGDFNLVPTSPSLAPINSLLKNLTVKSGVKTTRNELTHKTEVCDYIFVSKDVKVKSFRVDDAIVSDHKALILEFD